MTLRASLEAAGLNVHTVSGWGTRGGSWAVGQPVAVMQHHTAPPVPFPVTSLYGDRLKANINVKPNGTVWLIAQKACNYSSGPGSSIVLGEARAGTPPTKNARERGLVDNTNGNPWFFNFENDHAGDGGPIPQVQLDAIVVATRVVLDHYGLGSGNVVSHAEWTARKRDPFWNGSMRAIDEIRELLEADMASPGQHLMVDLAFNLFPDELKGDPGYWHGLDENSPEWDQAFRPALSRGAQRLYQKIQAGGGAHDHDGRYAKDVTVNR